MKNGEDIDNAQCAMLVGRNPYAADPTQWRALKALKKRGGRIVVIDPIQGPASRIADVYLRPRPGTDAALALSIAHLLVKWGSYDSEFVERWCHGFEQYKERIDKFSPAKTCLCVLYIVRNHDTNVLQILNHNCPILREGVQSKGRALRPFLALAASKHQQFCSRDPVLDQSPQFGRPAF